ncbi:hypothetical protein Hanom_Chr04g00310551 [Helianthus anomalus]
MILRFVKWRSRFECGENAHIVRNFPYLTKGKAKVDAPRGNNYHNRTGSRKRDPHFVKQREVKQKKK